MPHTRIIPPCVSFENDNDDDDEVVVVSPPPQLPSLSYRMNNVRQGGTIKKRTKVLFVVGKGGRSNRTSDSSATTMQRNDVTFRPIIAHTDEEYYHHCHHSFATSSLQHLEPPRQDESKNKKMSSYAAVGPWMPPLYRNTSLLSSPSTLEGTTRTTTAATTTTDTRDADLPNDFIPPRHVFSLPTRSNTRMHGVAHHQEQGTSPRRTYKVLTPRSSPTISMMEGLRPNDIICGRRKHSTGRGGGGVSSPSSSLSRSPSTTKGNEMYQRLVRQYQTKYLFAKRSDKPILAMEVLKKVHELGMRFVRCEKRRMDQQKTTMNHRLNRHHNSSDNEYHHHHCQYVWVELDEQRAYEKVCHSLRLGAPELRRRLVLSPASFSSRPSSSPSSSSVTSAATTKAPLMDRTNCIHRNTSSVASEETTSTSSTRIMGNQRFRYHDENHRRSYHCSDHGGDDGDFCYDLRREKENYSPIPYSYSEI